MKKLFATILCLFFITGFVASCDNDGPAEEAGENIDNTLDDASDSAEDLGDDIEDEVE